MQGRRVLVTGATGALGAGVVAKLLAMGAEVYTPMLEAELPAHVPWRADPRVHAIPKVSLDDEAQVGKLYDVPELWAAVHLVGGFAMAPITSTSLADFEKQWRLNLVTCFLGCREAVRAMQRGKAGGRIVNVAARPVIAPVGGMLAYTTAKAGVAALTQGLAAEVIGDRILVNAVMPSIIDSGANRAAMPNADFASWPKPAEIAETIAYLVSPANALTSGALVPVFGRA